MQEIYLPSFQIFIFYAVFLFLQVVGLVCVIMGIACHVKFYEPFNYIARAYVNIITIFIVAGIVMMIAGGLGIFCIVKKSYSSLMSCLIILAVLIILHFILGGLAFSYRSRVGSIYVSLQYVFFFISSL